jgi:hypothetical protein
MVEKRLACLVTMAMLSLAAPAAAKTLAGVGLAVKQFLVVVDDDDQEIDKIPAAGFDGARYEVRGHDPGMLQILLPSGKLGWISVSDLKPLVKTDRRCSRVAGRNTKTVTTANMGLFEDLCR